MDLLEYTLVILFALYFVGTVFRIVGMLERKRADGAVERARIVFFFTACLMLVCLIPISLADLLTGPVLIGNLAVVLVDLIGYALTFDVSLPAFGGLGRGRKADAQGTRVYQIYYEGDPFGIIAKPDFDRLLHHGLLKRQRTVELVEDYSRKARELGVKIQILKNRDGSQTLVRVSDDR